jgi:hypothetical protein
MRGSRVRTLGSLSLVALLACVLTLLAFRAGSAGAKERIAPSYKVKAVPAENFKAGPKAQLGSLVPLGLADVAAGAQGSSQPAHGAPLGPSSLPGSGPPVLINEPGLTRNDNGAYVPDTTGGIGPKHYIEMTNGKIAVYDRKNLRLISSANTNTEFQPGGSFIDPQIQWDEQAQRWLYLAIGPRDASANNNFTLAFGWSKTSDPTDVNPGDGTIGWCRYLVPTTDRSDWPLGYFDDYPKLGHDDTHLVFGTNVYRHGGLGIPSLRGSRIWTLPKPARGQTACPSAPVATVFGDPLNHNGLKTEDDNQAFTPVPTKTIESTDRTYVVAADKPNAGDTANQIMAWHVTGPATSPVLVADGNINVASYAQPQDVPQPGTLDAIELPDVGARLTAAVEDTDPDAGAHTVWTQHTIDGADGRSEVRWYELLPETKTARQQGVVSSSLDSVFNGAVSPTKHGNEAAIFYNLASGTQVPQIGARTRRSDTPLGQMSGETIVATSDDVLECGGADDSDPCRWGDYSAASPDPRNAHAVWGTNELAGPRTTTNYNWKSRNFAVSVRRPHRFSALSVRERTP